MQLSNWICTSATVISHYVLMCHCVWLNILTVDMYLRFRSHEHSLTMPDTTWKDIKGYLMIGWGLPLIEVAIFLLLDNIQRIPKTFKIEYGNGECWMKPRGTDHVMFYVTFMAKVCINVIFFTLICIHLYKGFKRRDKLIPDRKSHFGTYVKLFIMTGVNYVLLFCFLIR